MRRDRSEFDDLAPLIKLIRATRVRPRD